MTGNLEKAQQTCKPWAQTYPHEIQAHRFLGLIYTVFGTYEKAIEETTKVLDLDPEQALWYDFLAGNNLQLDGLGEADGILQRPAVRQLEIPEFLILRHDIAFLRGDQTGMEREAALAWGNPESRPRFRTVKPLPWPRRQRRRFQKRCTWSMAPPLRSRLATNHGDISGAIELLHRGVEAAAEFQKIIDHRGIVVSDPIGALAHLQLGRALARSGDTSKAKAAYQDSLSLPILQQAKAEYAKLQA